MGKRKAEEQSIQDFLIDVYTTEKELALARIRGTQQGIDVIRQISELWTKEDVIHSEDMITRLRRFVLHLNALKIIVRHHTPGTGTKTGECSYCTEDGHTIDCSYPCDTLRWLAMPYLGYKNFNPAWAVDREQFEDLSLLHAQELHENVELLRRRKESP
jgi:hypothetical protein